MEQDCTPLMEACAAGNVRSVKCLLDLGADVNAYSISQNTPLIYAAAAGQEKALVFRTLFKLRLISTRDEELHTALMEAAMDGHLEISTFKPCLLFQVARVLIQAGAPVNLTSEAYESPLTLSCCGGHAELAKLLIDAGANIEETNDENYTPLMEAAREGYVVLDVLVKYGGDLELGTNTPLMEAAQEGHASTVNYILAAVKPNFDYDGRTALMKAAKNGFTEIVEFLVTKGADVNARSSNGDATALSLACSAGHREIVKLLLKCGADPNIELKVRVFIAFVRNLSLLVRARFFVFRISRMILRRTLPTVAHSVNLSTKASQASLSPATVSGLVPALGVVQASMSNVAVPASTGFANLRRAHSEGDDLDITRATASQRAAFNVDKATESNNDTPLTLACSNGHAQMVDVLVCRGANIEHRDKKGFTPLILAATGGHRDVVELLLNSGAQIEAQSERTKDTALSLACSGGRKEVVELLLSRGANKEHRNVSDYTPLSLAASGGYVEIVNMLLNAGAEINSRTGSKLGISPLMLAAMNGHKEATRVLLEQGSDINAQIETNRNTALTLACFQGRTEVVGLLLQYNANVEHRAKTGLTPLMEAANGGYVEVGELLLDACADPNTAPVPSSRDTALTIAADKGHERFVDMLVNRGAHIDARNKKGCTALWLACHGGHLETVQTLVKHGADVDMQDNRKMSPLMVAFRKGHVKVGRMYRALKSCYLQNFELLQSCRECMDLIVKAKNAQAEEANRAAESLLALLAEEVIGEAARSKKQAKMRKKEKKKEKKAKKQDFTEKERNAAAPTETQTRVQQSSPINRVKEESEVHVSHMSKNNFIWHLRWLSLHVLSRLMFKSVGSSVIARVIGRGGANINAIREATGASIEVEKQSAVRRDQHDRQICIRGTQETVRYVLFAQIFGPCFPSPIGFLA
uniref:ANK_REP_REGION domain-containing protein n=1 Tax=Angiostrongylus cantonensis TaxID=6313 RepID=A0A158PCG1_ANGCA